MYIIHYSSLIIKKSSPLDRRLAALTWLKSALSAPCCQRILETRIHIPNIVCSATRIDPRIEQNSRHDAYNYHIIFSVRYQVHKAHTTTSWSRPLASTYTYKYKHDAFFILIHLWSHPVLLQVLLPNGVRIAKVSGFMLVLLLIHC